MGSRIYLKFAEENNLPFFSSAKIKMESYDDTRRLKKKRKKKKLEYINILCNKIRFFKSFE